MNAMLRRTVLCGAVVAAMMLAAPAMAGPWSNPTGTADNFGDPFVSGDTFIFNGSNWQANAPAGTGLVSVDDTLSVHVRAKPLRQFDFLRVYVFGSYAVTGDTSNYVDAFGEMSATETGGLLRNWTGPLVTSPAMPVEGADSGIWDAGATLDFDLVLPTPDDELDITLSQTILAFSTESGSAEINVQFEQLWLEFVVIPEPSSLALLAVGGLALLRRRR